jgi:hypothetical protein
MASRPEREAIPGTACSLCRSLDANFVTNARSRSFPGLWRGRRIGNAITSLHDGVAISVSRIPRHEDFRRDQAMPATCSVITLRSSDESRGPSAVVRGCALGENWFDERCFVAFEIEIAG